MANETIPNSIDYSQPFILYSPISAGVGGQPAITIANEIQNLVCGPPFCWAWNRKEDSSTSTAAGAQDYTINLTDFAYLEMISLTDPNGVVYQILDCYNNKARGIADATKAKQARPNSACVIQVIYGTSVKIRFMGVPDQIYLITLTYQKLITPMSTLTGGTGTWTIPPQYSDIYNNLFLAESFDLVDNPEATKYRQRGVTSLLAKSEGLSELQIGAFLEQFWSRVGQQQAAGLRVTQATQARGV
jgi:hypothetical protein